MFTYDANGGLGPAIIGAVLVQSHVPDALSPCEITA